MRKPERLLVVPVVVLLAAGAAAADDSVKPYATTAALSIDGAKVGGVVAHERATNARADVAPN